MIVKDEAEYLPKCLQSAAPIVDEIIIVDTGSTDDTVAIAESFGAKVIHMPWPNSFAAARNRSLEEATGDWILWLDADEAIDTEEAGKLKELLGRDLVRQQHIEGIQFQFLNYTRDSVETVPLQRMIRNRPEYRFEGVIHEQILPSMQNSHANCTVGDVDIHVHHYGNLPEILLGKDKIRRNLNLLHQALSNDPKDTVPFYYLGVEYYRVNALEQALKSFNHFLANSSNTTSVVMLSSAHKFRLLVLQLMERYTDLVQQGMESIGLFPDYTDLYHLVASGWKELQRPDKAIKALQKALKIGPAVGPYASMQGIGTYQTAHALAELFNSIGNAEQAGVYYAQAQAMKSGIVSDVKPE
ncbi:glycosyltransferase family 2 protein [Paenibacillus albidus]|nr:glycosyltransferase family 2 protein [Paenibacillus albidus]